MCNLCEPRRRSPCPSTRAQTCPWASPEGSWTRPPRFLPAPGSRSPRPGRASAGPPRLAPARGPPGPAALLPAPGRRVCAPRAPWTGALQGTRRCLTRRGPRPHEKRSCLSTAMAGLPRSGRKCARQGRRVREPQVGETGLAREDPPGRLGLPAPHPPGQSPGLSSAFLCSSYLVLPIAVVD